MLLVCEAPGVSVIRARLITLVEVEDSGFTPGGGVPDLHRRVGGGDGKREMEPEFAGRSERQLLNLRDKIWGFDGHRVGAKWNIR